MQKFDKIKIITSIYYIDNINDKQFSSVLQDGVIVRKEFTQTEPYLLYIKIDYLKEELIIEFTGKILKERYYELINKNNINVCFDNLNSIGVCTLSIPQIINDSQVCKADVTKDIICNDHQSLTKDIKANIKNFKTYLVQDINDNIIIEKNVHTKNRKLRLSIYNKAKEMRLCKNKEFINSLSNSNTLREYFNNKTRFELNLNSKKQIRDLLHIKDLSLTSVLSCASEPIFEFLNKVLIDTPDILNKATTLRDYERALLVKECNNDIAQVEAVVRSLISPHTHISQTMKPYFKIISSINHENIKARLRNLLLEFITIIFIVSI